MRRGPTSGTGSQVLPGSSHLLPAAVGHRPVSAWRLALASALGLALLVAGCHDEGALGAGAGCLADRECASGFCWAGCRDPRADDDGDGLDNAAERLLGTSPDHADTDGDGVSDRDEVGSSLAAPRDTDGDGIIDALESARADRDGDCVPDELDGSDDTAEPAELARLMCPRLGVCEGASVAARCDGQVVCDLRGAAGYEPVEATCDGRDNDCDGRTDEGLTYLSSSGEVLVVGDPCLGRGVCASELGVVECAPSGLVICSVDAGGSESAGAATDADCDGLDNDCDGDIDDGITWVEPDSGVVRRAGEPCRERGNCGLVPGVVECAPDEPRGICSTGPGGSADRSAPERCDGLDEDCDGRVDDGLVWRDPTGIPVPVGAACGRGVCAGDAVVCAGGVATCAGLVRASAEVCNGLDDDCDGETDEARDVAAGCSRLGACASREVEARCDGETLSCRYRAGAVFLAAPPSELACDGLDEDCDGEVDEDLVTPEGRRVGERCVGSGLCATVMGFVVCGDGGGLVCSADAGIAEVCDGVDNDCDGLTDEQLLGPPDCPPLGVCLDAAEDAICRDGAWWCAHEALPDWIAAETAGECDGLDNDCDGVVDEGSVRGPAGALDTVFSAPPVALAAARADGGGFGWRHGGVVDGRVVGDLWRWSAGLWERLPQGPARAGHALVYEPGSGLLLVLGGFAVASAQGGPLGVDGEAVFSTLAFSPRSGQWVVPADAFEGDVSSADGADVALARRILGRRHPVALSLGGGRVVVHGGWGEAGAPEAVLGRVAVVDGAVTITWAPIATGLGASSWAGHSAALLEVAGGPFIVLAGGVGAPTGFAAWSLSGVAVSAGPGEGPVGLTRVATVVDGRRVVAFVSGQRFDAALEPGPAGRPTLAVVSRPGPSWVGEAQAWRDASTVGLLAIGEGRVFAADGGGDLGERLDWAWPAPRTGARLILGPAYPGGVAGRAGVGAAWLSGGRREVDGLAADGPWAWPIEPSGEVRAWRRVEAAGGVDEAPGAAALVTSAGQALWAFEARAQRLVAWRLPTAGAGVWESVELSGAPVGGDPLGGPETKVGAIVDATGAEVGVFAIARANGIELARVRWGPSGATWDSLGHWAEASPLVLGPRFPTSGGAPELEALALTAGGFAVRAIDPEAPAQAALGPVVNLGGRPDQPLVAAWDPHAEVGFAASTAGLWVLDGAARSARLVPMALPPLAGLFVGPDGAAWALGGPGLVLWRLPLGCGEVAPAR